MSNIIRCEKGHFYDAAKHSSCPHCGVQELNLGETQPLRMHNSFEGAEQRIGEVSPVSLNDEGKTVGIMRKKIGLDPVVGWLVCVEGANKGRDYRLHSEKNFVGRAPEMDIHISGDESISRRNHVCISFNPKKNSFSVYPGEGSRLAYLNDEEIYQALPLKANDIIEVGETKLMFIPLCGGNFQWE